MGRIQKGYIYEASGSFFIRYWTTVDGQRVQKSERLCQKDEKFYSRKARSVKLLASEFMNGVNQRQAGQRAVRGADMIVADFWEQVYMPYCTEIVPLTGLPRKKPSTLRNYRQIWRQHLKAHFGNVTLQEYEADSGTDFLQSLTGTQGQTTIRHIKALGGAIFKKALKDRRVKSNVWHDVQIPDDAIPSEATLHLTWEETENYISALVARPDCQLIVALTCFQGMRPGEVQGLRWEDISPEYIHVRRAVVRGHIGTPKTAESIADIPILPQVLPVLAVWADKNGHPTDGWVFPAQDSDMPVAIHNLVKRVIKPTLKAAGIPWKRGGLYCGRRGSCTEVIERSNGNAALAQALLRHKNLTTTVNVYKKQISRSAFFNGIKALGTKQ